MRKLSLVSLSLALALGMMPITAFAAAGDSSDSSSETEAMTNTSHVLDDITYQYSPDSLSFTPDDNSISAFAIEARSTVKDITLKDGETAGPYNLSQGQEVKVNFSVQGTSFSGLVFQQTNSLSSGNSFHAILEDGAGKVIADWDIAHNTATASFGPFILGTGKYSFRLQAQCEATLRAGISCPSADLDAEIEIEPNDTMSTATPVKLGQVYTGMAYDPDGEVFLNGKPMGLSDIDIYSFHIDSPSLVNVDLLTRGKMHYEVTKSTSQVAFKQGNTLSGENRTTVNCGRLEAGTYYFVMQSGSVWRDHYIFTVSATPTEITRVELSQTEYEYSGSRCEPTVSVYAGNTLIEKDLSLTGSSRYVTISGDKYKKDAGTYTITVQGKGDLSGTVQATYTIKPKALTRIELSQDSFEMWSHQAARYPTVYVYSGAEKIGTYYSFSAGDEDISVVFPANAGPAGTYEITAQGRGNYTGTLKATYRIYDPDAPSNPSNPSQPSNPSNPSTPSQPSNPDPTPTDPQPVGTETMYRLYNPNSGEHFYTSSPVERDAVIAAGWNDEGVGWTAPTEGIKVYRLYNSFAGEHHYTSSEAERDMLVGVGWTWEEGGWYSDPNEAVPLYRAYNPNAFANNHHYTLDWGEFQTLLSIGWKDEGVGWHGVK